MDDNNVFNLQDKLEEMNIFMTLSDISLTELPSNINSFLQKTQEEIADLSRKCYEYDFEFFSKIESYYSLFCFYFQFSDSQLVSSIYQKIVLDWIQNGYVPLNLKNVSILMNHLLLSDSYPGVLLELFSHLNFNIYTNEQELLSLIDQYLFNFSETCSFEKSVMLATNVHEAILQGSYQNVKKK